jgi:hypothetical protein
VSFDGLDEPAWMHDVEEWTMDQLARGLRQLSADVLVTPFSRYSTVTVALILGWNEQR